MRGVKNVADDLFKRFSQPAQQPQETQPSQGLFKRFSAPPPEAQEAVAPQQELSALPTAAPQQQWPTRARDRVDTSPQEAGRQVINAMAGANRTAYDLANFLPAIGRMAGQGLGVPDKYLPADIKDAIPLAKDYYEATTKPYPESQGYQFGQFAASPTGKMKGLDVASGALAEFGRQYFGEGGELAGLIPAVASLYKGGAPKTVKIEDNVVPKSSLSPEQYSSTEYILENVDDRGQTVRDVRRALGEGEQGSLAQITGAQELYNVEKGAASTTGGAQIAQARQLRDQQQLDAMSQQFGLPDMPEGQAARDIADTTAARLQAAQQRAGEGIDARALREQAAFKRQQEEMVSTEQRALTQATEARRAEEAKQIEAVNAQREAAEQEALAAQAAAEQARIQPPADLAETGKAVSAEMDTYSTQLKETAKYEELGGKTEQELWTAFDEAPPVNAATYKDEMAQAMNAAVRDPIKVEEMLKAKEFKRAASFTQDTSPNSVQSVLRDLKDKSWNKELSSDEQLMYRAASERLEGLLTSSVPEFAAANQATRNRYVLLGDKVVQGALKGRSARQTGEQLFKPKAEGADNAEALLVAMKDENFPTDKVGKALEDHILSRVPAEGVTDKFLKQHEPFLNVWRTERPEFVSRLENANSTTKLAEAKTASASQWGKDAEQARKVIEAETKGVVGTLTKATEKRQTELGRQLKDAAKGQRKETKARGGALEKAVTGSPLAMFSKDPVKAVRKWLPSRSVEDGRAWDSTVKKLKTPEEKALFKRTVGDEFLDMATKTGGDFEALTPAQLNKQLQVMRDKMKDVLTPEEMKALGDQALIIAKDKALSTRARPVQIKEAVNRMDNIMASVKASIAMSFAPVKAQQKLALTNAVRSWFKGQYAKGVDPARIASLNDMLSDPKAFLNAIDLDSLNTADDVTRRLDAMSKQATTGQRAGQALQKAAVAAGGE